MPSGGRPVMADTPRGKRKKDGGTLRYTTLKLVGSRAAAKACPTSAPAEALVASSKARPDTKKLPERLPKVCRWKSLHRKYFVRQF